MKNISRQPTPNKAASTRIARPWLWVAVLAILLLALMALGSWRASGTGAQVQVPMFYDAHYLFPRPWTQAQSAPGVDDPAGLAFYGDNRVSQTFVAGADRLSGLELWLAGDSDQVVLVTLSDGTQTHSAEIPLSHGIAGGTYTIALPTMADSQSKPFVVTLSAPQASAESPVTTRTIGGDRLGGALRINEFLRPGNLELQTFSRGLPGAWWLQALGEQLLPATFRLRLQQYKPPAFKGNLFAGLLAISAVLTGVLLVLAAPPVRWSRQRLSSVAGWSLAALLALFLGWQIGTARVKLPWISAEIPAQASTEPQAIAPSAETPTRLLDDITAVLWTGVREPEARFVSTELVNGMPAIRVPAESRLLVRRDLPPNASLRVGMQVAEAGQLRMQVWVNGAVRVDELVSGSSSAEASEIVWHEIALGADPLQGAAIEWTTTPVEGAPDGLWVMPQLSVETNDWLLTNSAEIDATVTDFQPDGTQFGERVALAGFATQQMGDQLAVALVWRALTPSAEYATIFVHLLNDQGEIVAQADAPPLAGSYPFPLWQPHTLVVDRHALTLPADLPAGDYTLSVGIYDPTTAVRWPVVLPDGGTNPDGRTLLTPPIEIAQ